jgi:eukaryotic-like serine/threonine-protein kinase
MPLSEGTQLGPYEILSLIGAGGMGEVHRARDTRLGRDVAIKVLPDIFAQDAERLTRLQREAQVLASLNHPHIAAIHDFQEHQSTRFLVLELVEGESLDDRIARGALPAAEAVNIARQIAEALEAAHEKGVVHRDLKPANIKVTPDGNVKVLDFGLAKMFEPDGASSAISNSPTLSALATGRGVILGTAAYMSPEQARGKPTDKRTDIWAFGCVLYEMLAGRQCFSGETVSDSIAAILGRDPDWQAVSNAPAGIQSLLRRCLQKDAQRRLRDIGEARIALEEFVTASASPSVAPAARTDKTKSNRLLSALLAAAVVAIGVLSVPAIRHLREGPVDAPEMRVDIVTPATTDPISFALSPDGRLLVFVASGVGPPQLWLRPLDSATAQPLPGTEGAVYPFWSPDNRSIGFFAGGKLKRTDIGGGLPQSLTAVLNGRGGTWNKDGTIVFSSNSALARISSAGGEAAPVIHLDSGQTSHRFPQFLPDGRHFLFFVQGVADRQGVYLGSLDESASKRLTAADTAGAYAAPGFLLFVRQGSLIAWKFDAVKGELVGDPLTVADPVGFDGGAYQGAFSVSAAGSIAYRAGGAGRRQLAWFDRAGKLLSTVGEPGDLIYVELSPDEKRIAVERTVQNNEDIYLIDAARGVPTRFTFDPSADRAPGWSPDGSRIVFTSNRKGSFDLYQKPANGAGNEELLLESPGTKTPVDWSPDGRSLLYYDTDPKTVSDLWVLPMAGEGKPRPFVKTPFDERYGQFSPDGQWVAYHSNENGRFEIFVQPFPGPGGKWQVSANGGIAPRWRRDGKEIFFISPDAKLMAAPVRVSGSAFESEAPVALFQTRIYGGGSLTAQKQQYAVSRDGRFLMNMSTEEAAASPITLILNWHPGR